MSLVLDSSATLAGVYADEITEPIRNVFNLVSENGAWVPGLWKLEVANILEMGVRDGAGSIGGLNEQEASCK